MFAPETDDDRKKHDVDEEQPHEVHPAALKIAMRYHIQRMCSSPHCVDSFVFYLNSPSKTDGTSLLWDVDGDGQVSPSVSQHVHSW